MSPKSNQPDLYINILDCKKAAIVIRAINHKLRRQIVQLIHENKRMTVSSIYKKLHLEQSVASQHLASLRKAGFVLHEREGKFIFYSVSYSRVKQVNQLTEELNNVVVKHQGL